MATRANASNRKSANPRPTRSRAGGRTAGGEGERQQGSGRAGGSSRAQGSGRQRQANRGVEERALVLPPPPLPRAAMTRRQRLTGTLETAGDAVRSAGNSVGGAVAENPVPVALIGAGLAWLLLGNRVRTAAEQAASAAAESELLDRARERFGEVSERVSSGIGEAAESISSAADAVRNGTSRLGEYAQDGARAVGSGVRVVGEQARRGYEYSRQGVSTAWEEHPLTSGLALLAAGVAVGLLLPATRRENAVMGRQADAVGRRVKTATRVLGQRGRKVASTVATALKEEVEGEGLGVEQVARKVRRIAGHLQEATVSAAKREGLDPATVLSESAPDAE